MYSLPAVSLVTERAHGDGGDVALVNRRRRRCGHETSARRRRS